MGDDGAPDAWTPLGWALIDYLQKPSPVHSMFVFMEDGERLPLPTSTFFRTPEDFPPVEQMALECCRGRVLDLGAGAGAHSLQLQQRGFDVTAVDICPAAVEVMRQRGLKDVRQADYLTLAADDDLAGHFDTLLLMMNGIGLVGEILELGPFFAAARRLLADDGQLLCDSTDLRLIDDAREIRRMQRRQELGRYLGETRQRIAYRGLAGAPFGWLYLDLDTLSRHATQHGWICQALFTADDGAYLARLTQSA